VVSVGPNPNVDQIEQMRQQVNRLAEEIAHLSEMDLAPAEYYGEYLQRVLTCLQAPAGAVWLRTPQGNLQLQYQINMRQVGLDSSETSRQTHDELLRQAAMQGQPRLVPPQSSVGNPEQGAAVAGNPTNYFILLAPILVEKQVAGMVEVWQDPNRGSDAQRGFLQFMVRMASLASGYTRNHQLRQMVGQQQVWTQLETFARQIHASLNPTEVSYLVANEGRRLAEADRVSVAQRQGNRAVVMAVSGADVVEKRSNLVQLMRTLFDRVQVWGEKLVYSGTKDDTLPPGVNKALDAYLAESNSKLLVVLPLKDDREEKSKRPPRSALMMECFEPNAAPEQLLARLEVVGRHATSALYNAAEHRRIPMRFIWGPLAHIQDGLGGKARAIITLVGLALVALVAVLILVPYPLKMDANGILLPIGRAWVFAPVPGRVEEIKKDLATGTFVFKDQEIMRLFDLDLKDKITDLQIKILTAQNTIRVLTGNKSKENEISAKLELEEARAKEFAYTNQLADLMRRTNSIQGKPGEFWLKAPIKGYILTGDFRENLFNRGVKPNDPLVRIGDFNMQNRKISEWEIELKIPQKHIGQVLTAFGVADVKQELDVDFLLSSKPTQTFKGKLAWNMIAKEATPNRDDHNESDPVVLARVRVSPRLGPDGQPDIAPEYQIPPELLLAGTEVHSRIRCGNHAMGYSLFYGVWEFLYEKVVFFF
jgi:hypothetical protein